MRVVFDFNGMQHEGETRDLSTCGTFVLSQTCEVEGELELTLDTGADALRITGDVVMVSTEGFAVAFRALHPDTTVRLERLLRPTPEPRGASSTPAEASTRSVRLQLQGDDWSPPLSQPEVVLASRSRFDSVSTPSSDAQEPIWGDFPTLSQPSEASPPNAQLPDPPQNPALPEATIETQAAAVDETANASPAQARTGQASIAYAQGAEPSVQQPLGSERRQNERHERIIPIHFDNLTALIKEFTHNISFGGMFVFIEQEVFPAEEAAVTLIHPIHGERLTLLAKVVHISSAPTVHPLTGKPRYGVGIEFRMPVEELKRVLSDFISSHQKPAAPPQSSQLIQEAKKLLERAEESPQNLLGVSAKPAGQEIRSAYFDLVDRFHPDRHFDKVSQSDLKILEELFRRLTKAYEALIHH